MANTLDNNLSASVSITGAETSVEALRARESELLEQPSLLDASEPSPIETPPVPMQTPRPASVRAAENAQWREMGADRQYQNLVQTLGPDVTAQRYEEWFGMLAPESSASTSSFMRFHQSAYGSDTSWNADTANARAASRPYVVSDTVSSGTTLSAAPNAGAAFDREAYERSRTTDYYVNNAAPETPAEEAPSLSRVEKRLPYTNGYASRVAEIQARQTEQAASTLTDTVAQPRASSPRYANAKEARDLDRLLRTGLEDEYAQAGRVPEIGGQGFNEELTAQRVEAELIAAPEARATGLARIKENFREDMKSPFGPLNYAFAAAQIGQGAAHNYEKMGTGDYVTPEQQSTAAAGMLPGAGALVGTLIGSAIMPGAGSWAGGIVGGGIASVAQGIIGANNERDQSIRQTSEMVGTLTGADASAVREFTEALRGGTAAVKDVGTAFATLTNAGPGVNTTTSLSGVQFMANALGERFNPALSGVEKAITSDPILRGLQPELGRTGGKLTAAQYGDLAVTEAFQGDFQASNDALTLQQGVQSSAYDRDKEFVDRWSKVPWYTNLLQWSKTDAAIDAQKRIDAGEKPDPAVAASQAQSVEEAQHAYGLYTDSASAQETVRAGVGLAQTRLELSQVSGGGSAAMGKQLDTIRELVRTNTPALEADAKGIGDYIAAHPDMNPQMRNALQRTIDDDLAAPEKLALLVKQGDRAQFDEQEREQAADYGFTQSAGSLSMMRGRLSGRSNADLQGEEDGAIAVTRSYAADQRRDAANPLVRPAERAAMLAQANALDTSALTESYNFREAGYAQNLGRIGLQSDQAALAVTNAQIGGGPSQNYEAAGQVVAAFQAKIAELTNEIQRGGLTLDDRTAKERELTGARAAAERAAFSRNEAYFSDAERLVGTQEDIASVGSGRAIRRGGNAAFDPNIISLGNQQIQTAQQKLAFDQANYGGNAQLIADDTLAVRRLSNAQDDRLDVENTYTRDGATTRRMMNDRAQAQIADLSPWMNGPQSNPLTAHAAEIRDVRSDLVALDANRGRAIAAGRWRDEDETTYTGQRNQDNVQLAQYERERVYSGLLPQEVQRLIGGERGGIGLAIQPMAAQAAASGAGYNPVFGGFGQHPSGSMTGGMASREGGPAGAWFAAAGGPGAMNGNHNADVVATLNVLISVVREGHRQGRSQAVNGPLNPQGGTAEYLRKITGGL